MYIVYGYTDHHEGQRSFMWIIAGVESATGRNVPDTDNDYLDNWIKSYSILPIFS